ncbi:hypothetical protein HDU76_005816 [Blyttiomyces sp. JEL0837]|nr:hypothetical protein HDU76_005816 [Blyttiomyces sp. JEL0837]
MKQQARLFPNLPQEIEDIIWTLMDPLTRHINGRSDLTYEPSFPGKLTPNKSPSLLLGKDIWQLAFESNWDGDASLLPFDDLPTVNEGLCKLKSRDLYRQLCLHRPDLCSLDYFTVLYTNNGQFGNGFRWSRRARNYQLLVGDLDEMEVGVRGVYFVPDNPYKINFYFPKPELLIHVPMRHGWFDLIDPSIFSNPIPLGYFAIRFGHTLLLKHLMDNYGLEPRRYKTPGMHDVLTVAILHGYLDMVQLLVDVVGFPLATMDLEFAASEGHLELLQWLAKRVPVDLSLSLDRISPFFGISSRLITLLRWLRDQTTRQMYVDLASKLFDYPYARSHMSCPTAMLLEIVKFLHDEAGIACPQFTFEQYVEYCHVDIVEYLLSKRENTFGQLTMAEAARNEIQELLGRLKPSMNFICKYHFDSFRTYFNIFPDSIDKYPHIDALACLKSLDKVKYLHDHGGIATVAAMDGAAEFGDLLMVKFLHNHRKEGCTIKAMDKAASYGHLSVVRFLHYNRSEGCTTNAMDDAASNGYLETVRWLHENRTEGCTTRAMDGAAKFGSMRVVQFLIENRKEGCTGDGIKSALSMKKFKVAKLLMETYPELKED